MDAQLKEWKLVVDRLWSAASPDYAQAARLAARSRATRSRTCSRRPRRLCRVCVGVPAGCRRAAKALARRRLGAVRDVLHALTAPRFGKRGSTMPNPEEHYRRLLGLPLGRRLFGPEINQAYKRAAKKVHPDAGGTEREFLELSKARDVLMKQL